MSLQHYFEEFLFALLSADRTSARKVIGLALQDGLDARELLLEVVQPALNLVGDEWSRKRASLTQVYAASRIAEDVTTTLVSLFPTRPAHSPRVVVGTIASDFHGLGRRMVVAFLRAAAIDVIDLGLDVSPAAFVEAAVNHRASIVAVSALMMHAVGQINEIRTILAERGRGDVRIVVGGAPFNLDRELYLKVGADAMVAHAGEVVAALQNLAVEKQ